MAIWSSIACSNFDFSLTVIPLDAFFAYASADFNSAMSITVAAMLKQVLERPSLNSSSISRSKCSLALRFFECADAVLSNECDIIFEFLIANERVMLLAKLTMTAPAFARCAFVAIPAEFDAFVFHRASDERTTDCHSRCAFASATLALATRVITWA